MSALQLDEPFTSKPIHQIAYTRRIPPQSDVNGVWLQWLLDDGVIGTNSLFYQEIGAMVEQLVSQVQISFQLIIILIFLKEVCNWAVYPTVSSFAESVFCHANESTFHLFRGRFGSGSRPRERASETEIFGGTRQVQDLISINHAWPSIRTLQQHLQRKSCDDDTTHWSWIFTMCEMAKRMPNTPRICSAAATRFMVSIQYDGQPLRQGAHVNKTNLVSLLLKYEV